MQDPILLKTIQDAIAYINQCVSDASEGYDKRQLASSIVNLHHSDFMDEWCNDDLFQSLIDEAESLEIEQDDSQFIDDDWERIKQLLTALNKKYPAV